MIDTIHIYVSSTMLEYFQTNEVHGLILTSLTPLSLPLKRDGPPTLEFSLEVSSSSNMPPSPPAEDTNER